MASNKNSKPLFSFGSNGITTSTTTPMFGTTPLFGNTQNQQQQQKPFAFALSQPQQQAQTAFGQPQQPAQTNIFGQVQQPAQTNLFGQAQQPAKTGLFGQPVQPQPALNLFGAAQQQQPPPVVNTLWTNPQPILTNNQQQMQCFAQLANLEFLANLYNGLMTLNENVKKLEQAQLQQNQNPLLAQAQTQSAAAVAPGAPTQPVVPNPLLGTNPYINPVYLTNFNGTQSQFLAPTGYSSSLALMDGYRTIWTPNGFQICPPNVSYQNPLLNEYFSKPHPGSGSDLGDAFKKGYELGRQSTSSYTDLLSHGPNRQMASTNLSDPYYPRRPYTAPILSSPSSTSIFFGADHNPELKNRTLAWRKGYGGRGNLFTEESYYKSPLDNTKYDSFANGMFSRRKYNDQYALHSLWRNLEDESKNRHFPRTTEFGHYDDQTVYTKPRNRVKFFDPYDSKYCNFVRRGPPIKSHMDEVDLNLYDRLWDVSNGNKATITVGNLPGRLTPRPEARGYNPTSTPLKSILKKPVHRIDIDSPRSEGYNLEVKDSPVFLSGHNTKNQSVNKEYPLTSKSSESLQELFRASNRSQTVG